MSVRSRIAGTAVASRRLVIALTVLSGTVAIVAALVLRPADSSISSATQLAAVYFGFVLTAQSVLFATAFSGTGRWPSMHDVARSTLFTEWILIGGVATLGSVVGTLLDWSHVTDAASFIWLIADALGTWTFLQLFTLATPEGRNVFLAKKLTEGLARSGGASASVEVQPTSIGSDSAVTSHRAAFAAAISSDSAEARDLVQQLAHSRSDATCHPQFINAQASLASQTVRAVIARTLEPRTAAELISEILAPPTGLEASTGSVSAAVQASAAASRYATWASGVLRRLARDQEMSALSASVLREAFEDVRGAHLRWADPSPANPTTEADREIPLRTAVDAMLWYRVFTSGLGAHSGGAVYVLFQALTGARYSNNFADGAPILRELVDEIHGPNPSSRPEADEARALFTDAGSLRYALAEAAVGQLHDFRPGNGAGGIRRDARAVAANLAVIASGWSDGADGVLSVIDQLVPPADRWFKIRTAHDRLAAALTPAPHSAVASRSGAATLVVALQLAAREPSNPQRIEALIERLPSEVAADAEALAADILIDIGIESGPPIKTLARLPREVLGRTS